MQRTTIYVSLSLYVSLTLSMYLSLSFLSLSLFLFLLFFLKCSLFVIFFSTYSVCLLFVSLSKRKKKGSIRKVSIGFILKCSHLLLYRARNYAIAPQLFSRLCRYFTSLSFLLFLCLHFFFILICFMFFCFSAFLYI